MKLLKLYVALGASPSMKIVYGNIKRREQLAAV